MSNPSALASGGSDLIHDRRHWLIYAAPILLLALISLWQRPPLPLDETRYLAVAWEMHLNGDWLVPHLNGRPYSQKPPLLFWIINGGWKVFGVNAWWPRLLPALAVLATFGLLLLLRRQLNRPLRRIRPPANAESDATFDAAPVTASRTVLASPLPLLVGSLAWPLYSTVLLFDMLMAMFAALGWLAVTRAWQGKGDGWPLTALAMGLGILCKGPVILLYVLPAALLAPRLPRTNPSRRWVWYLQLLLATAAAAAIALAWAIPAANHGGQAYADDILWGQTAGRVQSSFSHDHPWWWYLPIIFALFLPWALMPKFWRALRTSLQSQTQRWLMASALLPFAVFTMMSGKQPHYLVPLMPLLALAISNQFQVHRPYWMPAVLGLALLVLPSSTLEPFRVESLAHKIHQLQQQDIPILHAGKYHGDFHFLGRLEHRIHVRKDQRKIPKWAASNPNGYLLITDRHADRTDFLGEAHLSQAVHEQAYRSAKLFLIPLADAPPLLPPDSDPARLHSGGGGS